MREAVVLVGVWAALFAGCAGQDASVKGEAVEGAASEALTEEEVAQYVECVPALEEYLAKRERKRLFKKRRPETRIVSFEEAIDAEIEKRRLGFRGLVKKRGYGDLETFSKVHNLVWEAYTYAVIAETQRRLKESIDAGNVRRLDDRGHPVSQSEMSLARRHAEASGAGVSETVQANAEVVAPFLPELKAADAAREGPEGDAPGRQEAGSSTAP